MINNFGLIAMYKPQTTYPAIHLQSAKNFRPTLQVYCTYLFVRLVGFPVANKTLSVIFMPNIELVIESSRRGVNGFDNKHITATAGNASRPVWSSGWYDGSTAWLPNEVEPMLVICAPVEAGLTEVEIKAGPAL
jgi:hypothetical protein